MADIKINVQVVEGQAKAALQGLDDRAKKLNNTFTLNTKSVKSLGIQIEKAFDGTPIATAANSLGAFTSRIVALGPILGAVAVAVGGVAAAFFFAKEGEQIAAITEQFKLMSEQAGASAAELTSALEAVGKGTVDTEDLLKATNKFIVEFTGNTQRIPEILDIAKKATAVFGGDVIETYESIGQALAAGNTRALRNVGIIVDQEVAYKNFAKTLGITVNELTDAGKKQAILEESLRKGNETFKNVNPNILQISEAFKKVKVQIGELFDFVAINANTAFGGIFAKALKNAADLLERFNVSIAPAKEGIEGIELQIRKTEIALDDTTKSLTKLKENLKQTGGTDQFQLVRVEQLEQQKSKLEATLDSLEQRALKFNQNVSQSSEEATTKNSKFIDEQKLAENLAKAEELKTQAKIKEEQLKLTEDERLTAEEQLKLERFQQNAEKELLIEQEKILRKAGLNKQADDIKKKQQEQQLKNDATYYKQLAALDTQYQQGKVNLIQAAGNLGTALAKDGSKAQFLIAKAAAIAGSIVATNLAAAQALATPPGPPATLPLAAQVRTIGAINTAAIVATAIKGFQDGGIVGGSSFSGDRVLARVNSGEMILNRQQQANLFNLANNGSSGQVVETHVTIELDSEVVGRAVSRQVANGLKLGEVT